MGQGAATPSKREHRHRPRRQQARLGHRAARQACRIDRRRRGLRKGGRPALLRDLCQDRRERARPVHGNREEAASGSGRPQAHQAGPATRRQSPAREPEHQRQRALQLLEKRVGSGSYGYDWGL